jgi:hypothetical protein
MEAAHNVALADADMHGLAENLGQPIQSELATTEVDWHYQWQRWVWFQCGKDGFVPSSGV